MSIASAISGALRTLKRHAGVTALYIAEDGTTIENLTVVPGQTDLERQTMEGLISQVRVQDFIVAAADLVKHGRRIEPKRGDKLIIEANGFKETWEVLPPGDSEEAWQPMDFARTAYRLHTKRAAREPTQ